MIYKFIYLFLPNSQKVNRHIQRVINSCHSNPFSQLVSIPQHCKMNSLDCTTEEDLYLSTFFPRDLPFTLQPLVEYRIRLCANSDSTIHAGESVNLETSFIVDKKLPNQCIYLKPYENLPLMSESGGFVHPRFSGRIMICVTNYKSEDVKIPSGTSIAYALCQPYSL